LVICNKLTAWKQHWVSRFQCP